MGKKRPGRFEATQLATLVKLEKEDTQEDIAQLISGVGNKLTKRGSLLMELIQSRKMVEARVADTIAPQPHIRFFFTSRTNRGEIM